MRRLNLLPTMGGMTTKLTKLKSMKLPEAVARAREVQDLSLRDVAKRAKMSPQGVSDVERGVGGRRAAVIVLRALKVPRATIRALVVRDVLRDLSLQLA